VAAVLSVLTSVWLTGGFHEDGLADSADGLGGAHGGKSAIEIMRDSRIGTYGALALTLVLALRATLIAELGPEGCAALPLSHCWARLGPVWLIATQPSASAVGGKSPLVSHAGIAQASVATAIGLLVGALLALSGWIEPIALLPAVAGLTLLTLWAARFSMRAVGGITGDLLGAGEQLGEALALLSILASLRWLH
jgi:adenosylcobinamide-GDP ribazoletransferase